MSQLFSKLRNVSKKYSVYIELPFSIVIIPLASQLKSKNLRDRLIMCSDSNLSWCTADDEYINLESRSDEAINYSVAKASSYLSMVEQQHTVNCDEYPAIRNGDRCATERPVHTMQNKRWTTYSYTWKVPWILIICSVVQVSSA